MLCILVLLIIIVVLIVLSYDTQCNDLDETLRILVRQGARWATAAKQDKNPLIATLHANYAAGYLWAINDIATPKRIRRATGIDYLRYKKEITTIQDNVTRRLVGVCPDFAPSTDYLSQIGGEA